MQNTCNLNSRFFKPYFQPAPKLAVSPKKPATKAKPTRGGRGG